MTAHQIRALARRAHLHVLVGGQRASEAEVYINRASTDVAGVTRKASNYLKLQRIISYRKHEAKLPEIPNSYQNCQNASGTSPALSDVTWPPLKVYPSPLDNRRERQPAREQSELEALRQEVNYLRQKNDIFWEIIVRLRNAIKFQVVFWERGLKYGQWKSEFQMKRELSSMKGALEYRRDDYPNKPLPDDDIK